MQLTERILQWNALAGRYAFSQLRPRNFGISISIYSCTVVVMTLLYLLAHQPLMGRELVLMRQLYGGFLVLQVFMLWVFGLHGSSSVVREEMDDRSVDFFRLLPVNPHARILGTLVGRNLSLLLLALFNGILLLSCGLAGGVRITVLAQVCALVTSGGAALMLAGLLSSTAQGRQQQSRNNSMALLMLCVFLLPYIFAMAVEGKTLLDGRARAVFYGISLPLLPLITIIIIYFAVWVYAGLIRRFLYERSPLFSPVGAVGFMAGFVFLATGLFWSSLDSRGSYTPIFLWVVLALPLLIVPFSSSRTYESYGEAVAAQKPAPRLGSRHSNLAPSFVNLLIWMVVTALLLPAEESLSLWHVAGVASFWLVMLLWTETAVVCAPLTTYFRRLGVLMVVLYMALPPLLAGVFDWESLTWFSPVGHMVMLERLLLQYPKEPDTPSALAVGRVVAFNITLAILLGYWIQLRYRALTATKCKPSQQA